jgi:cation diffusion facilitator CzcD-associated flavoprotein CzcO
VSLNSHGEQVDYDAVIIGAGFAGIRMLHELRTRGLTVRVLEKGYGPGGTWHWNRYPGAHSDTPSWVYCFLFDKDLLQDWDWNEKFPAQADMEAYFNHVLDRFDMRKDIQFDTAVSAAEFDEETDRWRVTTASGEVFKCTYLISATGVLHAVQEPPFPGVEEFAGESYVTGHWPVHPVDFVGKRVAVIGAGASAVQSIPIIAADADILTVFQRTPNYVLPARNVALDDWQRNAIKRSYDHLKELISHHPFALAQELPNRLFSETPPERREAMFERAWELGDFQFIFSTYDDMLTNPDANEMGAEFVRKKIRAIVQDPQTAEILVPKNYPIFSKRPPVGVNYYETYNRPNVHVVDLRANPITRIISSGIELGDGTVHEVDMIVYALGFDAATGSMSRIDCRGRGGESLREKWLRAPDTFLGLTVEGFPNMFMLSGPGAQFSNFPPAIDGQAEWIGKAIDHTRALGAEVMEPTRSAVEQWSALITQIADATVLAKGAEVNSWIYGQNIPGKPKATYFFLGGVPMYLKTINAEADACYPGFSFSSARATTRTS